MKGRSARVAAVLVAVALFGDPEAGAQPTSPPSAAPSTPPPGFEPAPAQPPPSAPPYPYPYPYSHGYPIAPPAPRPQPAKELDYVAGQPIPDDYRLVRRENKVLVMSGALFFGIPYLGGAAGAGLVMLTIGAYDALGGEGSDVTPYIPLFVPVAGPFLTLYTARQDLEGSTNLLLVADGVLQTVGMGLLLGGFVFPEQVLVYRGHGTPAPPPPAPVTLHLVPTLAPSRTGLALAGTL